MIIFLIAISLVIAGIAKAIMDKVNFHYDNSIFGRSNLNRAFWDLRISHLRKYKNNSKEDGARFLGSTTVFVMFTDAWHLFGFIQGFSFAAAFTMIGFSVSGIGLTIGTAILGYACARGVFQLIFKNILK